MRILGNKINIETVWPRIDNLFCIVCFIVIFFRLALFFTDHINIYNEYFDRKRYEFLYEHSPYNVEKSEFLGYIEDPELYQLAGLRYISLEDPTNINFELQPLTKYLFGISIFLFGNAAVFQLLSGILLLMLVFFFTKSALSSKFYSTIPLVLLVHDPLFLEQLTRPYLDLFQSCALTFFFMVFLHDLEKNYISIYIMPLLGIFALSKSFLTAAVVWIACLLFLFAKKRNLLRSYFFSLPLLFLTYAIGYFIYFLHHNIKEFFYLHIRILKLYKSNVPEYPKGEIFHIIFFGKWREWFGNFGMMNVSTWTFLWPVSYLITCISVVFSLIKPNKKILFLSFWCMLYLVILSLKLVFPRYLMLIIPYFYMIIAFFLYRCSQLIRRNLIVYRY